MGTVRRPEGAPTDISRALSAQVTRLRRRRPGVKGVIGIRREGEDRFIRIGADGTTIFEVGSVSKLFTATLLAAATGSGGVTLSSPVADCVSELAALPSWLTLERLATHTSGLPRLPGNLWRSWSLHPRDPYASYHDRHLIAFLQQWVPPASPPGPDAVRYSNLGYELLTLALERRLDGRYPELLREWITGPLGLADTSAGPGPHTRGRRAGPRNSFGLPTPAWHFPALGGAGSVHSTASDLLRFLGAALVQPAGPLGPAFAMTQALRTTSPVTATAPVVNGGGLGWMIQRSLSTGRAILWHNGATFGSQAFVAVDPQSDSAVAVLLARGRGLLDAVLDAPTADELGTTMLRAVAVY